MNKDILYLSSCGGHLTQLLKIAKYLDYRNVLFVVNDQVHLDEFMVGKTIFIKHIERYSLMHIITFFEAILIYIKYKPKVFISTGAAPAVIFSLAYKIFGVKIIFVESLSKIINPSLTGRIMYYLTDQMYVQWPAIKKKFKRAIYLGNLL